MKQGHTPQVNWARYYGFCIILILMGWKLGGDLSDEINLVVRAIQRESMPIKARVAIDVIRRGLGLMWLLARKTITRS